MPVQAPVLLSAELVNLILADKRIIKIIGNTASNNIIVACEDGLCRAIKFSYGSIDWIDSYPVTP